MTGPPSERVRRAFGLTGEPVAIADGRGTSWRIGRAVLKPVDVDPRQLAWHAEVLASVTFDGIRVPAPLATVTGTYSADGWSAFPWVPGQHEPHRGTELLEVAARFHAATAHLEAPAFLTDRDDPWWRADRHAWCDVDPGPAGTAKHVERLLAATTPQPVVEAQLVHCDLAGNVLFDPVEAPAVLDLSLYWRPTSYADAIVVVDSVVWQGAHAALADSVPADAVLRALVFRLVAEHLAEPGSTDRPDQDDPYLELVRRTLDRATPAV